GEREDGDEEGAALHPSPFSKTRIQLTTASQSIAASQSSLRSASSRRATASVTAKQGLAVTNYAQAQDVDTISVTKATAGRYHLSSIGDLGRIAGKLSLGAPAPLLTVPYGVPALKRVYGVVFQRFVPLPAGGTVTQLALLNGTVQAAGIFSTDPSIARYGFVSLKDPKRIFAAENVLAVFKQSVLTKPMLAACNTVAARLDTATLRDLDGRVTAGEDPAAVASTWLKDAGIAK